jgi:hypothetical protein
MHNPLYDLLIQNKEGAMFFLNSHEKFYISRVEKMSEDGGGSSTMSRHASKPVASLRGQETVLHEGFNKHSVIMPDGCQINISADGTVEITEPDGVPRKVRHKTSIAQGLIK